MTSTTIDSLQFNDCNANLVTAYILYITVYYYYYHLAIIILYVRKLIIKG